MIKSSPESPEIVSLPEPLLRVSSPPNPVRISLPLVIDCEINRCLTSSMVQMVPSEK